MRSPTVDRWHAVLTARDLGALDSLIADDAIFHSPIVHSPQNGKAITIFYLTAAFHILLDSGFQYVRQVIGERDAILEFTAEIDGIHVNGVDMIHWNTDGLIDDFKVMVRPLKAVNLLHGQMRTMLESMKTTET